MRHSLLVALLGIAVMAMPLVAQKPVITQADQLPVHSYAVSEPASKVLQDSAAMARLTGELRHDIESDLATYDIEDQTTRRDDYQALAQIALLEGRFDAARAYTDSVRRLQSKPAERLLTGLMLPAEEAAARAPSREAKQTFSSTLERSLAALPYDSVQEELKAMAGGLAELAPGLVIGLTQSRYDPPSASGHISEGIALALLGNAVSLGVVYPYRDETMTQLNALIAAHHVEKADIWLARDVSLDGAKGLTPVVVAINDVGTDVRLFPGRVWTNTKEIPGNRRDDDHDGYVDDVHGLGWAWDGKEVPGTLRSLSPYTPADIDTASSFMEGFSDLRAHLNTPAAQKLEATIEKLKPAEAKPQYERMEFYVNYAHGTHVAGIAARGNPAIRLQVDRIEFPYRVIPPPPTEVWATAFAAAMRRTVAYYKRTGVRVVNMSWGLSPTDLQQMLEANRIGVSDSARKAMAIGYFDTVADAFKRAIADAPNVLFVSAAGNSDNSNAFAQFIPASFDLPNTIAVGAVDQAGDQAAFTSFGKVDVYANGYEVKSVLPGGRQEDWSGTSMASPQVVNLAAKLLAAHPKLTPVEVKRLIIQGADEKLVGGRTIRLLNEKQSFALAGGI